MRPLRLLLCLAAVTTLRAEPLISEFMAGNTNGLTEENGSRPDWIEIRNPDAVPALMTGWALTDAAANPQKWILPAVTTRPALTGNSPGRGSSGPSSSEASGNFTVHTHSGSVAHAFRNFNPPSRLNAQPRPSGASA